MDSDTQKKSLEDVKSYLPEGEEIINEYSVGVSRIYTTSERLFIFRRHPRSFTEVLYSEIIGIDHYSRILWGDLAKAAISLGIALYSIFVGQGRLLESLISSILYSIAPAAGSSGFPAHLSGFIILGLVGFGLLHTIIFLSSMPGMLELSRKRRMPVQINTGMTPEVASLIKEIAEHMNEKYLEKRKPIVIQSAEAVDAGEHEENIRKSLVEEFDGLVDSGVVVVSVESRQHISSVSALLDLIVNERGMGGVYVSLTRPYEYILKALETAEVRSTDIYFIDCISQMAGKVPDKTEKNIVFIENPSSLEEVTMYLDRMFSRVSSPKKFLFIDSLSSLLIYNNEKSVKEFTHFIINKMRIEGVMGVLLSIKKKEADEMIEALTPMCDKIIRL